MKRWFTRRRAPAQQLLAQVNGLLLRQDSLERQGRLITTALDKLQHALSDLQAATTQALERCEAAAQAAERAAAEAHDAALVQATEAVHDLCIRMNGHRPVTPGLAGD